MLNKEKDEHLLSGLQTKKHQGNLFIICMWVISSRKQLAIEKNVIKFAIIKQ